MSRYAILNAIRQLDPVKDHQRIVHLDGAYEFPWLSQRALEFALFRTYAVPSISGLLHKTGQFEKYGQRRYDDTALIIAEIGENGYTSARGRAAIRRMNQIHHRFEISNEDYLFVLSTFIFEPIRWIDRFGWRKLIDIEKQAGYYFWREVGVRMNIRDIPPSYGSFEQYNVDYERAHFRYSHSNRYVAEATIQIFLNWYAPPLRPLVRRGIYALVDDPLRSAFGLPKVHSSTEKIASGGLKVRAFMLRRFFPPRRKPYLFTREPNRTYPDGYTVEALGPVEPPQPRIQDWQDSPEHVAGD